ncbi:hypothetical protein ACJX0J_041695, partial [Zea mays]
MKKKSNKSKQTDGNIYIKGKPGTKQLNATMLARLASSSDAPREDDYHKKMKAQNQQGSQICSKLWMGVQGKHPGTARGAKLSIIQIPFIFNTRYTIAGTPLKAFTFNDIGGTFSILPIKLGVFLFFNH